MSQKETIDFIRELLFGKNENLQIVIPHLDDLNSILIEITKDYSYSVIDFGLMEDRSAVMNSDPHEPIITQKFWMSHVERDVLFIRNIHLMPDPRKAYYQIKDTMKDVPVVIVLSSKVDGIWQRLMFQYDRYPKTLVLSPKTVLESDIDMVFSKEELMSYVIFGNYAQIKQITQDTNEIKRLLNSTYLQDIEPFIRRSNSMIITLLIVLAENIGEYISARELNKMIQQKTGESLNEMTIIEYILQLQEVGLIFSISTKSLDRNREHKEAVKYYFIDTGIRNALIGDFSALNNREDADKLWENFCLSIQHRYIEYENYMSRSRSGYSWSNYDGRNIPYLHRTEKIGYFFSWSDVSNAFEREYAQSNSIELELITPKNFNSELSLFKSVCNYTTR
jgi:predicted AAA+ superfamily ATPase